MAAAGSCRAHAGYHMAAGAARTLLHPRAQPHPPLPPLSLPLGLNVEQEARRQATGGSHGQVSDQTRSWRAPPEPAAPPRPRLGSHHHRGPAGGPGRHDRLRSVCKDTARTCTHRYTRRTPAAAPAHRRGHTSHLYTCRDPSTLCRLRRCRAGDTHCCYLQARGKHTGRRESRGSSRPRVPTEVGTALHKGHKVARGQDASGPGPAGQRAASTWLRAQRHAPSAMRCAPRRSHPAPQPLFNNLLLPFPCETELQVTGHTHRSTDAPRSRRQGRHGLRSKLCGRLTAAASRALPTSPAATPEPSAGLQCLPLSKVSPSEL